MDGDFLERSFTELTGHGPFPWQRRLFCDYLQHGRTPSAIDVPTGLGKTAVMALWLIAVRAGVQGLARRLVYIVDRRAVVDQATEEAERLSIGSTVTVSTLRGQHADNRLWLADPSAPAIIVGTVDMIGSRLLFSGYGMGRGMRPCAAGLIGRDAWIVLDEAHLNQPFAATLRAIAEDAALTAGRPPVPGLSVTTLSATNAEAAGRFSLVAEDRSHPVVAQRLGAAKALSVEQLPAAASLPVTLAERAVSRACGGRRVVVFVHSRKSATEVAEEVHKQTKTQPLLLVGARRVEERTALADALAAAGYLPARDDARSLEDPPPMLIATAAGEVGIDLDADDMVADLVPIERMIQRLGRVNRRGEGSARVDVLVTDLDPKVAPADCLHATETLLQMLPRNADSTFDASPAALMMLRDTSSTAVAAASTPAPHHPPLTRPTVDAWAMTSLLEHPGRPDIAPWLRGWIEEDEPETTLVWRRFLPWHQKMTAPDGKTVERFFDITRPDLREQLSVSAILAANTLKKRAIRLNKTASGEQEGEHTLSSNSPVVLVLDRDRRPVGHFTLDILADQAPKDLAERLVGRTVVVSAGLGGLDGDGLLDEKADGPVACLDHGWPETTLDAIGHRVLGPHEPVPEGWAEEARFTLDPETEDDDGAIVVAVRRAKDGEDQVGDLAIQRSVETLADHTAAVVAEADALARRLNLADDHRRMLLVAAKLHDCGKARPMWQRAMSAPRDGGPYAKTRGPSVPAAMTMAGEIYRHEFGSLRDALDDPDLAALPAELQDLALHLIASHHGHARPLIAAIDEAAPPSTNAALAEEAMRRFARLNRAWGPWGLAWWEGLLRAADRRASALGAAHYLEPRDD